MSGPGTRLGDRRIASGRRSATSCRNHQAKWTTCGQETHLEAVEFATLQWVDWFNTRRLLEPIGYVPPAEYEARYYEEQAKVA